MRLMNQKINLIYELDGDVDDGLNVFELTPVLLSIGKLIQEGNRIAYPFGREIAVNVKPFQKNSFIIDIVLFAQTNLQQIIDFVNQESIQQIKNVLEWMGIVTGGGCGVIKLIKYMKGKPKTIEDLKGGDFRYTGEENNSITVNDKVHNIFQNSNVQKLIYNVYGSSFDKEQINEIHSFIKSEEKTSKESVKKSEALYFKTYASLSLPILDSEDDITNEIILFLNPKRGSFEGDANSWSFRVGNDIITATIKDEDFLEKLKIGTIRLYSGDVIKARLLQKQKRSGTVTYDIINVDEYIPSKPLTQISLD
jgi:hypothetical protein